MGRYRVACGSGAGEGPTDSGAGRDDLFQALLDPSFVETAAVTEPSAEDRAKATARARRQEDLRRRLAEEHHHNEQLAKRDRRVRRKHAGRMRRMLGPAIVILLIAGVVWIETRETDQATVAAPSSERPPGYPPVDKSASAKPLGTPPPAPSTAGPYDFVARQQVDSGPVAWDPCRPVHYVVNATGAPPGSEQLLATAITNTATATGLQFIADGPTDEPWTNDREAYQPTRYGRRWAPALIAWSNDQAVPGLAGYIAGLGGGTARSDSTGRMAYVSGQVVLDGQDLSEILTQPNGADAARATIQHELGHLVGLDHVADPTQLMYTEGSPTQTGEWGSGDLAGLHILGSQRCLPDL